MKKLLAMLAGSALALMLTGCMFTTPETSLYRLPKLAGEYESLEKQIDALLSNGAEYAAPTSGSNLQSVQMVDLDGDGSEEAVAFFRKTSDEKPMKIYIFKADGDSYEQYAVIEGTSTSIYSINYADLDGDGRRELLVGYKSSSDVQGFAVYPLRRGTPEALLVTGYSRYANLDLDGDGKQELFIIYSNAESAACVDLYGWDGQTLRVQSSLRLSMAVAELSRLSAGTLTGGEGALFVTGVTADNMTVTDVLALRNGRLQNVALGPDGNQIPAASAFLGLYPCDANNDGVTEAPDSRALRNLDEEHSALYCAVWRQYSAEGETNDVCSCFHDVPDGWSLTLPEEWEISSLAAERSAGTEETSVSFYRIDESGTVERLLTVYRFTGEAREELASADGRFTLARQVEATYAAELGKAWGAALDETSLRDRFSLIVAEWTTGDN